eukprot:1793394-Ditylum_brightwellii.AAC.1
MSAKFVKLALQHKIYVHGVIRKCGWGLPPCVLQEEVTPRTGQFAVHGTVKTAILCGDPECEGLVAVSVYDTKPICFLITTNESIEWIEKTREVYSREHGKKIIIKYLHLNINNDYNHRMGHIDVADLLHSYYRGYH